VQSPAQPPSSSPSWESGETADAGFGATPPTPTARSVARWGAAFPAKSSVWGQGGSYFAQPPPQPLAEIREDDPELPARLDTLNNQRFPGLTGAQANVGALGNFRIYHVPENGNCAFEAVGYFLDRDQMNVRWQIHNFAQDVLDGRRNPDLDVFTPPVLLDIRNKIMTNGRFGGENEIRLAAVVAGRRLLIFHHDFGTNWNKWTQP
jgi:hypothetical protein